MALQLTHTTFSGFPAVHIHTGPLSLILLPELGGKIASLRDERTGREWLWRHPRLPYKRVPHGSLYVTEADTGGWDECFPSVAACAYPSAPWAGAAIQDHGELWSQAAELNIEESDNTVTLRTRWQGVALPYTFERTLTLTANSARMRAEYAVHNRADAPLDFIWSAHPVLAIEPGMVVQVPSSARFNTWVTLPADLLPSTRDLHFPLTAQGHDLSPLPEPCGIALKLWSEPVFAGHAALRANDGALHMTWDVLRLPQLGLWLNLGAWAGDGGAPLYNLGLEPCIGAQDSLEQAVNHEGLFTTLAPRDSYAWWLEVELTHENH
jgi:galactose mutarotase-like enzyme